MAKKNEEAFKEREEGLQNFPPLFSNDCNTGEEDKKVGKWIKAIAEFIKALIQLSNVMKPLIEWCKSFFELL